ncbi:hypothetical protein DRQ12_10045 [candidate division KSB1 bacterium]|nr:MAG: hypothetical protein DRQ12_10045 [candidate division KSB1 bacterium]
MPMMLKTTPWRNKFIALSRDPKSRVEKLYWEFLEYRLARPPDPFFAYDLGTLFPLLEHLRNHFRWGLETL